MKFGKQILSQQFTEWSPYYLDYKGLKKFISSLLKTPEASLRDLGLPVFEDRSNLLQSQKAAFFFKLERELEKINAFYLQKENELKVRLRSLVDKKKVLQSDIQQLKRASALFQAIQEAFIQFEQELTKLQKYVELNNLGFQKILKKWDKRSKSSTKELYLSRQIDIQPCFNTQILSELSDMVAVQRIELANIQDTIPPSPDINSKFDVDDVELDLVKSAYSGNHTRLKHIVDRITRNPSPEDNAIMTRVFWQACFESSIEIIHILIETGLVDFKYSDDIMERSCLHTAAMKGRVNLLALCLDRGAPVDSIDVYGRTALHYATMNGFNDCVSFLLSRQTDIECRDHDSFSPLLYAIIHGHTGCAEILLDNNANFEPRFEGDHIPLSVACSFGRTEIALMLHTRGAKNLPNAESLYPLHLAARQGHTDLCRLFVEDIDRPDKYNTWTPLFWAANDGHVDCVRVLIDEGCQVNIKDEKGYTALYYAAWEGHLHCVQLLLDAGCRVEVMPDIYAPSAPQSPVVQDPDIPMLSLPPPIIPFRVYGHNYLDRRYHVQITLPSSPVRLYDHGHISSLRLVMSSTDMPHSVILPLVEDHHLCFQIDKLDDFRLEFDILPTFGSKILGRGVALNHLFSMMNATIEENPCHVPLLNSRLKVIGELSFQYSVIKPFRGVQLEIGGRIETYWKSPTKNTMPNITSSLSGEYLRVTVQLTKDLVPVVFSNWLIQYEGLQVAVSDLTFKQFMTMGEHVLQSSSLEEFTICPVTGNSSMIQKLYNFKSFVSLEQVLQKLPSSLGINIELKYPTPRDLDNHVFNNITDRNLFIDTILQCIYTHVRSASVDANRQLFFSSSNPAICTAVNWKQPNYAVFLGTLNNGNKSTSLKSAVKFAKQNNLLGIIYDSKLLVQVPALIKTTKESGLILMTVGESNTNPTDRSLQERYGVDAIMVHDIISFQ